MGRFVNRKNRNNKADTIAIVKLFLIMAALGFGIYIFDTLRG